VRSCRATCYSVAASGQPRLHAVDEPIWIPPTRLRPIHIPRILGPRLFPGAGSHRNLDGGFVNISTLSSLSMFRGWAQGPKHLGQRIGCTRRGRYRWARRCPAEAAAAGAPVAASTCPRAAASAALSAGNETGDLEMGNLRRRLRASPDKPRPQDETSRNESINHVPTPKASAIHARIPPDFNRSGSYHTDERLADPRTAVESWIFVISIRIEPHTSCPCV